MTTQLWVLHAPQVLRMPVEGSAEHGGAVACSSEGVPFLLMLGYDMFLVLVLLLVCPLVARSKRNYREGVFFSVASVLYALVWLAWLSAYVLAPPEWRAPAAAAGLVGAATTVLVTVFIPRTYLMVSSVARARIASAIPCAAAGMHNSSVLDINYRSSHQALYDSVNTLGPCASVTRANDRLSPRGSPAARGYAHSGTHRGTGLANPNYYSEHPEPRASSASTVLAGSRVGNYGNGGNNNALSQLAMAGSRDRLSPSPENTYERYDSPPSPHKVTRF